MEILAAHYGIDTDEMIAYGVELRADEDAAPPINNWTVVETEEIDAE